MRFKVTGGTDGLSGVEVAGRRYEPGDIVELTGSKADWLVAQGYLESADGKGTKTTSNPAPEPVPVATESEPAQSPTDTNTTETAEGTE